MRFNILILLFFCNFCFATNSVWADKNYTYLAVFDQGKITAWRLNNNNHSLAESFPSSNLKTPLGSVWKLFIYAYIKAQKINTTDYICTGKNIEQERYCCSKGGSIGIEQALLKSCGLYFEPKRINIHKETWSTYWRKQKAPIWLYELDNMREDKIIFVEELLRGIASIEDNIKKQAETTLLNLWLKRDNEQSLSILGTKIRAKTYTMRHLENKGKRIGGFAGWLVDGRTIWLGASGNSMGILKKLGSLMQGQNILDSKMVNDNSCIWVKYFDFRNNAIKKITHNKKEVTSGLLNKGNYSVELMKGQKIDIISNNDMFVSLNNNNQYILKAKLSLNEYIARVLEREASNNSEQAAKALIVAIRTYTLNEATSEQDCLAISDSPLTQRVLPKPASNKSNDLVASLDKLILKDSGGHYQKDTSDYHQLSWKLAVEQSKQNMNFIQILFNAYPKVSLQISGNELSVKCETIPNADLWLENNYRKWHKKIRYKTGYHALKKLPAICYYRGTPYVDINSNRIYIRKFQSIDDQVILMHEYLHLVFANHPSSDDENYIEDLAQQLIKGKFNE